MPVQQESLFRGLEPLPGIPTLDVGTVRKETHKRLRSYQAKIASEAWRLLLDRHSCLVTMATGLGKTVVASEVIRLAIEAGRRVLWIVHREELVHQAYNTLRHIADTQREMRSWRADGGAKIVVASKDSLRHRLKEYPKDHFGLIVTDEVHHGIARTYRRIYEHFGAGGPACYHLGLTATPDRTDSVALGSDLGGIFASATVPFTINDGISSGWLVPFVVRRIVLGDVDLSSVRIVAGDLNQADLSAIMEAERPLHAAATALLAETRDRPTIVFASSVSHAERLAEILNRHNAGTARVVTGETPTDIRSGMFRSFGSEFQFLLNYGVATEGTDLPAVRCVAMLRPTKSRLIWTQCAGRGTRPEPGIDSCEDSDRARHLWIETSRKPNCLLLDFVGAVGRHSIVGPMDVLGGKASKEVREIAAQLTESQAIRPEEALRKALEIAEERKRKLEEEKERKRLANEARRAAIRAKASYKSSDVDPMALMRSGTGDLLSISDGPNPAQVDEARKLGLIFPKDCTTREASQVIANEKDRRSRGLASAKQVRRLQQWYPYLKDLILTKTSKEAQHMIFTKLRSFKGGWK